MNAASNAPDDELTTQEATIAGPGPIQGPPGAGGALPGAQTAQTVQRPAGGAYPADAGPAGDDSPTGDNGLTGNDSLTGDNSRLAGGTTDSPGENEPGPVGAVAADLHKGNGFAPSREPGARLLEEDELQRIVTRWREIQAHFVDEPRTAVERADALVAGLMQQLATMFARERAELEQRWADGDGASTEELRQSLRRYRLLFERLLAA